MIFKGETGELFELESVDDRNCEVLKMQTPDTLRLLWFTSDNNRLRIDGIEHEFDTNEIICLTQFHHLDIDHVESVNILRFNRPFYCILDHDSEVGCKGILYYGAPSIPKLLIEGMDLEILATAWKMALLEFEMHDSLQLEMLQMMLKRILILCTRIYKKQSGLRSLDHQQNDLVREFNYLVETHFREKHAVADYAEMLHKSPKTISNSFKKVNEKSPLQFIQERIVVEARRLLKFSKKDISEVAYEIGFNDLQSFSRFFKKQEGISPSEYRSS